MQKSFIKKTTASGRTPVILHIDAHCDICDEYLGNKYSHACTIHRTLDNGLKQENLFLIGIREFVKDGYDILIENNNGTHLFLGTDVLDNGFDEFKKEMIKKSGDDFRIYVSFDIDSLDAPYCPGTGAPETCGLTPTIVRKILVFVADFGNVEYIDLV